MKKITLYLILIIVIGFLIAIFISANDLSKLTREIKKANYCQVKEDCELVSSKCPFGCNVYVNKNETERINALMDSYESKCEYSCLHFPKVECIEGKCIPKDFLTPDSNKKLEISSDECKTRGGIVEHLNCSEEKIYIGTIYDVKDVDRICCK